MMPKIVAMENPITFNVVMDKTDVEKVELVAAELGMKRSNLTRRLLTQFVNDFGKRQSSFDKLFEVRIDEAIELPEETNEFISNAMTVGEFIKTKRLEAGMSQAELYRAIGGKAVDGSNTISRIETGKQQPYFWQVESILSALDCKIIIKKEGE